MRTLDARSDLLWGLCEPGTGGEATSLVTQGGEWYAVDRMKGLTLSELNWRETRRFNLGDVTVIGGEFDAFDWSTFSRELQPITLRWLQRAARPETDSNCS